MADQVVSLPKPDAAIHAVQAEQMLQFGKKLAEFQELRENDKQEILGAVSRLAQDVKEGFKATDKKMSDGFAEHDDRLNTVENRGKYSPIQIGAAIIALMGAASVPAGFLYWLSLGPIVDGLKTVSDEQTQMKSRSDTRYREILDVLAANSKKFEETDQGLNRVEVQFNGLTKYLNQRAMYQHMLLQQIWPKELPPLSPINYYPEWGNDVPKDRLEAYPIYR